MKETKSLETAKTLSNDLRGYFKKRMVELGLDRREVAKRLGTTPDNVSTILSQKGALSLKTVVRFCLVLKTEFEFLLKERQ